MSYGPGRYDNNYEINGIDYPYEYVRWTENRNLESFLNLLVWKNLSKQLITHRFELITLNRPMKFYKMIAKPLGILIKYPNKTDLIKNLVLKVKSLSKK